MQGSRRESSRARQPPRTCLYCRKTKDASLFNREHVLPKSFGTFEPNNFVLSVRRPPPAAVVCRECNSYFGRVFEDPLGHDSIEGLDRYEQKLKPPKSDTAFGRSGALLRATADEGDYAGASIYWAPSEDGSELAVYFDPQVGFLQGGLRHWAPVDAIPTVEELRGLGFEGTFDIRVPPGVDAQAVQRELAAKGYPATRFDTLEPGPPSVKLDIRGTVDRKLQRAVAKIAYNYLAYHEPRTAMMEPFDDIRRYIRCDARLSRRPVTIERGPVVRFHGPLAERVQDHDPVAHVVAVEWRNEQLVAQVSLFFRFRYWIVLADGGFVVRPEWVNRGHIFDPHAGRIAELVYVRQE